MDETNQPQNENGIAGKPLAPQLDANGNVYESLQATNTPRPEMPKIDSGEIIANLHKDSELPNLRTYESDIAEAIKQDKASLINIAVSSNKKIQEKEGKIATVVITPQEETTPRAKSSAPLILLIIILIIGSAGALGGLGYYFYTKSTVTPSIVETPESKVLPSENIERIVITDSSVIQDILATKLASANTTTNKIGRYVFMEQVAIEDPQKNSSTTTRPVAPDVFAARLNTEMPSWLARSVTGYAVGYYKNDRIEPFLIFKVNSFENGFAGMLKWEPTMRQDLMKILPAEMGTTTSTSSPIWKDKIIQNKNTRVLYSGTGEPLLYYSLTDKETIVITASEAGLKDLISRLTVSQFSR